ncbi:MAG: GHKL domain-containing protein [Treponema sp.]|nr:GHKL domain-containing protein [Treponema sp.]
MREVFLVVMPVLMVYTNSIFMILCLPLRKTLFFAFIVITIMIVLNAAADILFINYGVFEIVSNFSFIRALLYIPILIWLLKGLFIQKIFAFLMQIIFIDALSTFIGSLVSIFYPFGENWFYFSFLILSFLIFAVYIILVYFFGRRLLKRLFEYGQKREWFLYSAGAGFSLALLEISKGLFIDNLPAAISVIIFILWSFCILCYAIINTHDKTKQKFEAELAREIISSGRDHYQKMNEQYDTLRIMKHDYKFHLNTALEMLQSGDIEKSSEYLSGLKDQLTDKELPNFCENAVINSLVIDYVRRCKEIDIDINVSILIPEDFIIPNYEMCIVLGNLLENALEACQKLTINRKIELAVKPKGDQLAIMVRNTFDGKVIMDGEKFVSTKKDGGLGLQSVNADIQRYGDMFYTNTEDEWFSAYVLWKKNIDV